MGDLLVVGSVALDSVETPFGKVQEALGGSATYFSYSSLFISSNPLRIAFVTFFRMRSSSGFSCNVSRETFNGRSAESITPLTNRR